MRSDALTPGKGTCDKPIQEQRASPTALWRVRAMLAAHAVCYRHLHTAEIKAFSLSTIYYVKIHFNRQYLYIQIITNAYR